MRVVVNNTYVKTVENTVCLNQIMDTLKRGKSNLVCPLYECSSMRGSLERHCPFQNL